MKALLRFALHVWNDYNRCEVPQASAALAYFMILTLFPLLLCVSYFVGLFHVSLELGLQAMGTVLPEAVLEILEDYLRYAARNQSPAVCVAALSAIVISASAGLRTLLSTMDRLYRRAVQRGFGRLVLSVALSVLYLLTIYLSILVIFTGEWFFRLLEEVLPPELLSLLPLEALSELWGDMRYLLLFCFVLLLVLLVYWAGSPRQEKGWGTVLAAALSAGAMVALSALFGWFISLSSRYSLLYGSLASLIILLVWLYFCGNLLFFGAILHSQIGRGRHRQVLEESK